MLSRENRIQSWFFRKIKKPAFSINLPSLSVKVYKNDKKKKFAVVVSKKIAKNSVDRNRLRRQIFAFIQENIESIPNNIYLIYPKENFQTKDLKEAFLKSSGM